MLTVINIEQTPNPNALKFVVNDAFVPYGSITYNTAREAAMDPLAAGLFQIPGVTSIFYMNDFVTVTKTEDVPWDQIVESAETTISSIVPVIGVAPPMPGNTEPVTFADGAEFETLNEKERLAKINRILDDDIRPSLAGDGGGLQVLGLDGYTLKVHYQGACGSCPTSTAGTLTAIEGLLKERVSGKLVLQAE